MASSQRASSASSRGGATQCRAPADHRRDDAHHPRRPKLHQRPRPPNLRPVQRSPRSTCASPRAFSSCWRCTRCTPRARGDADCNWTSPVSAIEWQSGLFFLLGGLVGALSVCRSLERARLAAPCSSRRPSAARCSPPRATRRAPSTSSSPSVSSRRSPCARRCGCRARRILWRDAVDASSKSLSEPLVLPFHGINSAVCALATVAVLGVLPRRRWRNVGAPALLASPPPCSPPLQRSTRSPTAPRAARSDAMTARRRESRRRRRRRRSECHARARSSWATAPPRRARRSTRATLARRAGCTCRRAATRRSRRPRGPASGRRGRRGRSAADEGPWPCDEAGARRSRPASCRARSSPRCTTAAPPLAISMTRRCRRRSTARAAWRTTASSAAGRASAATPRAAPPSIGSPPSALTSRRRRSRRARRRSGRRGSRWRRRTTRAARRRARRGCRYRLQRVSGSARQWHGVAKAELGRQWCPELVWSPVTHLPETVATHVSACPPTASRALRRRPISPSARRRPPLRCSCSLDSTASLATWRRRWWAPPSASPSTRAAASIVAPSRSHTAAAVAAFAVGLQLTKQLRRAEAVEGHPQPMPSADAFLRAGVHRVCSLARSRSGSSSCC